MRNDASNASSAAPDDRSSRRKRSPVKQLLNHVFDECQEIANAQTPGSTLRITAILQQLSIIYYLDVRRQAFLSFLSAFGAAVVGMVFFTYALWRVMQPGGHESAYVGLWAGGLTQFISAVNFLLYFKVARQFASFHICLERMNRFLLANTMSDSLDPSRRDEIRRTIVEIIASAPMIRLDVDTPMPEPND